MSINIFVSPDGKDTNTGSEARPVATLQTARALLRKRRKAAQSDPGGTITLRQGIYYQKKPFVLGKLDAGVPPVFSKNTLEAEEPVPTTITSFPGERAVISGGRLITGFKEAEINGVTAWAARIPGATTGKVDFKHLWVNGKRASRTRLPDEGLYQISKPVEDPTRKKIAAAHHGFASVGGHLKFTYAAGDLYQFANLQDVDFVALHFWVASRVPFESIDTKKRIAQLAFRPNYALTDDYSGKGALYYVENVREALKEPGQWYLDKSDGILYYIPRNGEKIQDVEVIAPNLETVVNIEDTSHITLNNVTVSHNEYRATDDTRELSGQAVPFVTGAVRISDCHRVNINTCTVAHTGSYGVEIVGDTYDCAVQKSTVTDLGAGGVKVFQTITAGESTKRMAAGRGTQWLSPKRIEISDCDISDGGYYHRQAVGVLVGKCEGVRVIHNEIHGFDYSGVSVGWEWGYGKESGGFGNIIEYNHIHDIGRGVLSDMGGIYHLGVAPGTRIRFNHIHDVWSRGYGGWGIYTDEGSTDVLIEHNLVHDTNRSSFHQHFGRRNILRYNIFAYGGEALFHVSRIEPGHDAVFVEQNIFYGGVEMTWLRNLGGVGSAKSLEEFAEHVPANGNTYFIEGNKKPAFAGKSFAEWKKAGNDRSGGVDDPLFKNPGKRDFTLKAASPALKRGFIPFDWNVAGPRR